MGTADDERLVREGLAGDPASQRRLCERLLETLQREVAFCLARSSARSHAEARQEMRDIVQDILVELFRRDGAVLRRWDPTKGRSLDSFARLVARRRTARVLERRRANPVATPETASPPDADDERDFLRRLESRDTLDAVLTALYANMSERDHTLFQLLYIDQIDPAEIADQLGLSRGAVNAWSYRTRKLARNLLESPTKPDRVSSAPLRAGKGERADG